MSDYTWPSIYFAYLFFGMCVAFGVYFFLRSFRDGYWGREAEAVKFLMFDGEAGDSSHTDKAPFPEVTNGLS